MTSSLSLRRLVAFGCALVLSPAVLAITGLSTEESDTIVKEDLAAAHVMFEICPAVIGTEVDLRAKLKEVTAPFLADLSDKTMTIEKLLADAEYQELLEQARLDAKETDEAERKEVCEQLVKL